jgi:hypothetical protein
MAYRLQEQKLLPGGLNLLAPGDQVAAGDCLNLSGWWASAAGKLEQAPAQTRRDSSGAPLLTRFDALCQADGRTYYASSDLGQLRQIGRAGEVPIDTGYDNTPPGMLSYQGYCWIMNRARQRKDNGVTTTDWTPAPPGVPALSNPGLASDELAITELDPASPDPTTGDYLLIRMWTTSSIAGLELGALMTIDTGGSATDYDGTWQVRAIYDGNPTSLIELSAKVPSGTGYTVAGGMTATFANPSLPMGDYQYWVTWAYTDLGESNPSTSGGVITAATQSVTTLGTKITVSIAALSPPSGAAYWHVYRKGPGMASAYRVNADPIPIATTTYDDFGDAAHSQDEASLLSLGILMEGDHDAAPACRVIANQVYNGRIVVANSATYPNRVWYTPALQPGFFRGSGNPQSGDWVDIGTDRGDEVLAMTVRPGMMIIYRAKSIWRHIGDFGSGRIECVVPDLGTVGVQAVTQTSIGDWLVSNDGIYKFNGDWAQKISAKIEPVFRGLAAENFLAIDTTRRSRCSIGYHNGRLWTSYPTNSISSQTLIYDTATDRWFADKGNYYAYANTGAQFLGAGFGVFTLETSLDSTVSILDFQSEYQDCGLPDHQKTFADLVISHNTRGQALSVRVRANKGGASSEITLATINSFSLTREVIPLVMPGTYPAGQPELGTPITAYNLSVRIVGSGATGQAVQIDGPILLHYYVEARKGKRFDTSATDHRIVGVKTVDQVEIDIDTSDGPAALQMWSDIPGGTMATRLSFGQAITQSHGRESRRLVLNTPVDGKLLRYQINTNTGLQVYAMRARVLPIGVYLDGLAGDVWQPTPISIGV